MHLTSRDHHAPRSPAGGIPGEVVEGLVSLIVSDIGEKRRPDRATGIQMKSNRDRRAASVPKRAMLRPTAVTVAGLGVIDRRRRARRSVSGPPGVQFHSQPRAKAGAPGRRDRVSPRRGEREFSSSRPRTWTSRLEMKEVSCVGTPGRRPHRSLPVRRVALQPSLRPGILTSRSPHGRRFASAGRGWRSSPLRA